MWKLCEYKRTHKWTLLNGLMKVFACKSHLLFQRKFSAAIYTFHLSSSVCKSLLTSYLLHTHSYSLMLLDIVSGSADVIKHHEVFQFSITSSLNMLCVAFWTLHVAYLHHIYPLSWPYFQFTHTSAGPFCDTWLLIWNLRFFSFNASCSGYCALSLMNLLACVVDVTTRDSWLPRSSWSCWWYRRWRKWAKRPQTRLKILYPCTGVALSPMC